MSKPIVQSTGSKIYLTWESDGIKMVVRKISDKSSTGLTGEVLIEYLPQKIIDTNLGNHLMIRKINLTSQQSLNTIIKALREMTDDYFPDIDWPRIMEQLVVNVSKYKGGNMESVLIGNTPVVNEEKHYIFPFIRKNAINIIYGAGGSGKSYLSVLFGLLVQSGKSYAGLAPDKGNVLYIDWESDPEDLNERLRAVKKGLVEVHPDIANIEFLYYRAKDKFVNEEDTIADMIVENDIKLIIIDSFGGALAGEINDSEASMQLANCLRSLGVSILGIDHVSKGNSNSPIGTVYKVNLARNLWSVTSKVDEINNQMEVVLKHTKTNSKKENPRVFNMKFHIDEQAYNITDKVSIESLSNNNSRLLEEIIHKEIEEQYG
tara:strand:- start:1180 stop:2307 length:1128 start_codon:yes stop_codon:yes gene_type:complete